MTSPRNYLLVFLALTTLGGAALAWRQHLQLVALRADSLSSAERDALQKKILDAQKRQHELEDELAASRASARAGAKAAANNAASQNSADDQRQRNQFGRFANMQARMNDPQFVKLMALQEKARLDSTYAPLFKQLTQQLNLSPDQLAAFQNLLTEKQNAARDVLIAARDQGLNPGTDRAEINQLMTQSIAEIDNQIQSSLGPDGFAQYQNYEHTLPERNTVSQLQQSLSYTSAPLTDSQAQQIINILAAHAPPSTTNPTSPRRLLGGENQPMLIPPDIVSQITPILSPSQIPALGPYIRPAASRPAAAASPPAGAVPTTGGQPAGR